MLETNIGYDYQVRINLQRAQGSNTRSFNGAESRVGGHGRKAAQSSRSVPRMSLISRRNRIFLAIYFSISIGALIYVIYVATYSNLSTKSVAKRREVKHRVHDANETLKHEEICIQWVCKNYDPHKLLHRSLITIVTAYINLGSFKKGDWNEYTTDTYWNWLTTYSKILTNVIFYTDDYAFGRRMLELRTYADQRTCVCYIDRSSLWSFSLLPRIKRIISKRGYPQHSPNTILPEYGAAMHAKYELMNTATTENVFETRYFTWADIGVFRSLIDTQDFRRIRPFELSLPPDFNHKRVAYTQVDPPDFQRSIDEYFTNNMVWLCGCYFIAERGVMQQWTVEYRRYVDLLLRIGWSSTDQQVLYSMYSHTFAFSEERPKIKIQTYLPHDDFNSFRWFHLALLCRHQGLKLKDSLKGHRTMLNNVSASNVMESQTNHLDDTGGKSSVNELEETYTNNNIDQLAAQGNANDVPALPSLYFEY